MNVHDAGLVFPDTRENTIGDQSRGKVTSREAGKHPGWEAVEVGRQLRDGATQPPWRTNHSAILPSRLIHNQGGINSNPLESLMQPIDRNVGPTLPIGVAQQNRLHRKKTPSI
jgi:hypothetical protein